MTVQPLLIDPSVLATVVFLFLALEPDLFASAQVYSPVMEKQEEAATKEMCAYAFDALVAALTKQSLPKRDIPRAEYPLFVTWKKRNSVPLATGSALPPTWDATTSSDAVDEKAHLRGCIGTFSAKPLASGLAQFALTSALHDSRFPPVKFSEIPQLSVSVSLLTHFEKAAHARDWQIGKHGIIIDFYADNDHIHATYLPDVMPEQGWNHDETLQSLAQKGGYYRKLSEDVIASMDVTRYQSSKASMLYEEYKASYYRGQDS